MRGLETLERMNREASDPVTVLLDNPATPGWARETIRSARNSDPVDAVLVLEALARAFKARLERIQPQVLGI